MKRLLSPLILGLVALIFAISAFADIARPKISPSPQKQGRTVFHTGLTIVTDPNSNEARLQISEESWRNLQQAVGNASPNGSVLQRISHSSVSTIMAGIFLFLSVPFV